MVADVRIAVLPGDGIGPEVTAQAVACLAQLSDRDGLGLTFSEHRFGGAAIDVDGVPLPAETLDACRGADAILLGAVGGPRWDLARERPEMGLLALRQTLGLFANLRPARVIPGLESFSPLKPEIASGADVLVVRELTGGIYFGKKTATDTAASDLCAYSSEEIERIAHVAFRAARKRRGKVTSVDKANVLATSRLWRRTVDAVAKAYPDVTLDHMLVDSTAMALVTQPTRFDVILTENMFGDILSDEMSVIAGSIGLLASASTGDGSVALFEPIHGSAPDIAGHDTANPAGTIASAVMLLDHLGFADAAESLRDALELALAEGSRTGDLGGTLGCKAFGARVRELVAAMPAKRMREVA